MRVRSVAREGFVPAAALLLLCLVVAGPLWGPGLVNTRAGGDSPFLLQRTHQMAVNLQAGVFPVRWMPDAAYGLGYPFFSYYAALPYYVASGLSASGLDVLSALKITQTLCFAAAALAMYGWARRLLRSKAGALLAAAAYTVAPFHLANVYVRGDSLSEFAAFAFYPLILWGLEYVFERPSAVRTLPAALAYAGLIATHNLSALIFSPFLLAYAVVLLASRGRRAAGGADTNEVRSRAVVLKAAKWGASAILLGLLLSVWYWLPALGEIQFVQLVAQTTGYFHYSNHFRAADLVQPAVLFGYGMGADGVSPFAMGLVQATLVAAGIVAVIVRLLRERRRGAEQGSSRARWVFVLGGFGLATFLITPLSRVLWDHLPLLEMVQFPWRFLSVQSLFAALLVGALVIGLGRRAWSVSLLVVVVLTAAQLGALDVDYLAIAADEVSTERLLLYEMFSGNIGTTVRHEYLPRDVEPRPYTGPALADPDAAPRALALDGELRSAEEVSRKPTRRVWLVEAGDGGAEVAFPVYYWPGWQASVDGEEAVLSPAPDLGYASLTLPPGTHSVELWLANTTLRTIAEVVSALAAFLVLALLSWRLARSIRRRETPGPDALVEWAQPALVLGGAVVACLVLLVILSPRVSGGSEDLTMDFAVMPYLHHNPDGVDLGPARLLRYDYSSDEIAPGDLLTVTLEWQQSLPGVQVEALLRPAGDHLNDTARVLASASATLDDTTMRLALLPSDTLSLARGLYLVSASVSDVDSHESIETVYLRPVWVNDAAPAVHLEALPDSGSGLLRLHESSVAWQQGSDTLGIRLDWSCSAPVPANYGLKLALSDQAGDEWVRVDTQPGHGFLATSLWRTDQLIPDALMLPLPEGTPPSADYMLAVELYSVATYEPAGQWALPVELPIATERPNAPVLLSFGDELALSSLNVPASAGQGESLDLSAYWLALERPSADYVSSWSLQGTQSNYDFDTLPLAAGSASSSWPSGAYVEGRASLDIPSMAPPGEYTLSVALSLPDGDQFGTYVYPQPVRIAEQPRVWDLPDMEREVGARFGGLIELAGYDIAYDESALVLTLHWQALADPLEHFMLFVHLAEPESGHPETQIDTMPRGFTYPTGLWIAGEVVSDEVVLFLEGVPPGIYDLAVGWYNPDTWVRLTAMDSGGAQLNDDRLVLPDGVVVR